MNNSKTIEKANNDINNHPNSANKLQELLERTADFLQKTHNKNFKKKFDFQKVTSLEKELEENLEKTNETLEKFKELKKNFVILLISSPANIDELMSNLKKSKNQLLSGLVQVSMLLVEAYQRKLSNTKNPDEKIEFTQNSLSYLKRAIDAYQVDPNYLEKYRNGIKDELLSLTAMVCNALAEIIPIQEKSQHKKKLCIETTITNTIVEFLLKSYQQTTDHSQSNKYFEAAIFITEISNPAHIEFNQHINQALFFQTPKDVAIYSDPQKFIENTQSQLKKIQSAYEKASKLHEKINLTNPLIQMNLYYMCEDLIRLTEKFYKLSLKRLIKYNYCLRKKLLEEALNTLNICENFKIDKTKILNLLGLENQIRIELSIIQKLVEAQKEYQHNLSCSERKESKNEDNVGNPSRKLSRIPSTESIFKHPKHKPEEDSEATIETCRKYLQPFLATVKK